MEQTKKPVRPAVKLILFLSFCIIVFTITVVIFEVSQASESDMIKAPTFQILANFLALITIFASSYFSFSVIRHSDLIAEENKKNNQAESKRSEAFRTMQFVASNFAAIDFVEYMLIYEVYNKYIEELKKTKNFQFYMHEDDVTLEEICADFNNFMFVAVRIPIVHLAGNQSVTSMKFSNFVFHGEDKKHNFIASGEARNALILYNKIDRRQEVLVNLAVKKSGEFWTKDTINPFLKITFNHTMFSLLGVAVSGWTELYFANPQKAEKDGANKYIINSSQFEISGLPKLSAAVETDITAPQPKA